MLDRITQPPAAGTGRPATSDERLDVKLSSPGTAGHRHQPEQLRRRLVGLFHERVALAAGQRRSPCRPTGPLTPRVDLGTTDGGPPPGRLNVSLPGVPREVAQALVTRAPDLPVFQGHARHIDVAINLV